VNIGVVKANLDQLGIGDVNKNVVSEYEFRENRRIESQPFLTGVNDFLSVLSSFIIRLG
jgi:hypothetical protein